MAGAATTPRGRHPRRRAGGRSARVVREVLEATLAVLARSGYATLSMGEVADRARVSRTTVYRRWPTKRDLVRAALLGAAGQHAVAPDTGATRGDLLAVVAATCAAPDAHPDARLARALLADLDDPELVAIARVVRERWREPLVAIVERGASRGELPRGVAPTLVLDLIFASVHQRLALFGEVPAPYAEAVVDLVLAGARAVAGGGGARAAP